MATGIFDLTGVTRGPDGIKCYDVLPRNLVHMLRDRGPAGRGRTLSAHPEIGSEGY